MGSSYLHLCLFLLLNCVIINCERDYVSELAAKCKIQVDVHRDIETEDGYLLTLHRLIPSRKEREYRIKTPVLMMHGLLGSAEHYIVLGCESSLAYLLLEQGYDVWLGSVRTVSYSRHHVTLDPNSAAYWNITMDSFGSYDLPSFIDYILKKTQHRQLMYVGHSQGTAIFYIMTSNKPEYADKVRLFVNLSPVATLVNLPHPWLTRVCRHIKTVEAVTKRFGLHEWTLGRDYIRKIGPFMCGGIFGGICKFFIYLFSGMRIYKIHREDMTRLLTNAPEGIAAQQFSHLCQVYNAQEFVKFDYGSAEANMDYYGTETPPKYSLSKMSTPAALYYSEKDWFLDNKEVPKIAAQLPNVVDLYQVPGRSFSHFDFVLGRDAPKVLYPRVIRIMNKLSNQENFTPNESNGRNINQTEMLDIDGGPRNEYQRIVGNALVQEEDC